MTLRCSPIVHAPRSTLTRVQANGLTVPRRLVAVVSSCRSVDVAVEARRSHSSQLCLAGGDDPSRTPTRPAVRRHSSRVNSHKREQKGDCAVMGLKSLGKCGRTGHLRDGSTECLGTGTLRRVWVGGGNQIRTNTSIRRPSLTLCS
jgi:hypothetical protein